MTTHRDIALALARVEDAVDVRTDMRRRQLGPEPVRAWCRVDADGFEIHLDVLPANRRIKRHTTIATNGRTFPTPDEAADELIRCLEFWAKAIAS